MKATKLIAIAIILGIASLGYAQTESTPTQGPNQSVVIMLKKAIHSPDLVRAMHAQLSPRLLEAEKPAYTFPVRFKHSTLYVNGTYNEWKAFFRTDANDDPSGAKGNLIPLNKAMRDANLVKAMRAQLTPKLISQEKQLYIAPVRFKHKIVYVSGNYDQWKKFFGIRPVELPKD